MRVVKLGLIYGRDKGNVLKYYIKRDHMRDQDIRVIVY
jgi:hypothetical protein